VRILANENFPSDAVFALRERGHDVVWMRSEAPGSTDRRILERAQTENRILLTFDKDFGELAFRYQLPASSGIVLFRIKAPSSTRVATRAVAALESRSDWAGHFAIIEEDRIRMVPLPGTQATT